jgi:mono/diheme cytochrome c family protein
MRTTVPGIRAIALVAGFVLCLASAALLAQDPATEAPGKVIANKLTKTYHRPSCAALKKAAAKNQLELENPGAAEIKGYKPCGLCKPNPEPADAKSKTSTGKASGAKGADADDKKVKFVRDVAPVFVGNCIGCHGPEQQKKKFDLSTFNKLMAGGASGKVITPKDPDESLLIQHVKGENGLRKMPPGNQRNLAPATIAKLEQWIRDGALLDAGVDPNALLSKIAPSTEDLRKSALAKLSPEQREKKLEEVGLERWAKGTSKTTPDLTSGKSFLVFSNLPKKRAEALAKAMEPQRTSLLALLGPAGASVLGSNEKISIYVFNDLAAYAEFLRGVENREPEPGVEAHGNLKVESPYLACVDPLNGHEEPPAAKKAAKSKKADDAEGPTRTLLGLVTEQLGAATANAAGKPPRYLALGVGAFLASGVEGRSPYYRQIRAEAYRTYEAGWNTKASEALGGEGDPDRLRAVGFSLMEWLSKTARPLMQGFVGRMLDGQEKLDETIKDGWGASRNDFLQGWGGWVGANYRRR